jgi:hypothetical protein
MFQPFSLESVAAEVSYRRGRVLADVGHGRWRHGRAPSQPDVGRSVPGAGPTQLPRQRTAPRTPAGAEGRSRARAA